MNARVRRLLRREQRTLVRRHLSGGDGDAIFRELAILEGSGSTSTSKLVKCRLGLSSCVPCVSGLVRSRQARPTDAGADVAPAGASERCPAVAVHVHHGCLQVHIRGKSYGPSVG